MKSKLFIVMTIQEDHENDIIGLNPIAICGNLGEVYEISDSIDGVSRIAVVEVLQNELFLIDENLKNAWVKDINHENRKIILFSLVEEKAIDK